MDSQTIVHGITFNRDSAGLPADAVGTPEFWEQPFHEMYAQHPFQAFWKALTLTVRHIDSKAIQEEINQGIANEEDFDPNKPGYQRAAGLYKGLSKGLYIPIRPYAVGEYPRPVSLADLIRSRGVVDHESGHFHDDMSRAWSNADDITRLSESVFMAIRPGQGQNKVEDWAECFRAVFGSDDARGKFSDNSPADSITPELHSFMRCVWWLSVALKDRWVVSLVPKSTGVMYQTWVGLGWRWRWVSAQDWHVEEHNGSGWVRI